MFVKFLYTIKNRDLLEGECFVLVDTKTVIIVGERTEMIYVDSPCAGYVKKKVLFINYNGVEYGNESMKVSEFRELVLCPSTDDDFQIFEEQFENIFE